MGNQVMGSWIRGKQAARNRHHGGNTRMCVHVLTVASHFWLSVLVLVHVSSQQDMIKYVGGLHREHVEA